MASLLSGLLRELAELAEAPGELRAQLTLMEEHIMAEIDDLRGAIADEITDALRSIPDAEALRLAVERADSAEQARSNIEDAFIEFRQRIVGLTGEVRAEGLFGQTTTPDTTTTTTGTDTTTDTTTEATTTVAPEDAPVVQPGNDAGTSDTSTGPSDGTGFEPVRP